MKLKCTLELEYDNYGGHGVQDFEDILIEGVNYLIDEGMISGHLEAILEGHDLSIEDISEKDHEE